jgi:hypothetical protein
VPAENDEKKENSEVQRLTHEASVYYTFLCVVGDVRQNDVI